MKKGRVKWTYEGGRLVGAGTRLESDEGDGMENRADSSQSGSVIPPASPLSPGGRGAGGEGAEGHIPVSPAMQARMVGVARGFRKEPTPSEARLWELVRGGRLGARFRRQQPIGPFVVDFFCARYRLIVEVDGPVHAQQVERDRARQALLEAAGYRVLRLSASEIEQDPAAALAAIEAALGTLAPRQ